MSTLVLAIAPALRRRAEGLLNDHTAGQWPRWVQFVDLTSADKAENDAEVHNVASGGSTLVLAASNITSAWVERLPGVERLPADKLLWRAATWLDENNKTWQSALKALKGLAGFQVADESKWRGQFTKIDPVRGPRIAKALLAQLRVVRSAELADILLAGPEFDFNVVFKGSDPHSGDLAMVAPLASRIDGDKLFESRELPQLPPGAHVRLFSDGSWSGGETEKRIKCLTRQCAHKAGFVGPQQSLTVSIGFMTTMARSRLERRADKLLKQGRIKKLDIVCPEENVLDAGSGPGLGLAFTNEDINSYVDPENPRAFFEFCEALGACVYSARPLGTDKLASTLAFEHSLPKAMLPMFIFGGAPVTAKDGSTFQWSPLLVSKHVQKPAKSHATHHCAECPLSPPATGAAKEAAPAGAAQGQQAQAASAASAADVQQAPASTQAPAAADPGAQNSSSA